MTELSPIDEGRKLKHIIGQTLLVDNKMPPALTRSLWDSKAHAAATSVNSEIVDLTKLAMGDINCAGGAKRDLIVGQCSASAALQNDDLPVRTAPNTSNGIDLNSHHVIASVTGSHFDQGDVLQLSLRKNGFRHYRNAFGLPLSPLRALDHEERDLPILDFAITDFGAGHWLEEMPIGAKVLLGLSPRREGGLQGARVTTVSVRNTKRNRLRWRLARWRHAGT